MTHFMRARSCSSPTSRTIPFSVLLLPLLLLATGLAASPFEGFYRGLVKFRGEVAGRVVESNAMWLTLTVDASGNLVTETIGTDKFQTTVRYLPYVRGVVQPDGAIVLADGAPFTPGMFDALPKPDTQVSGSVMKITSRDYTISAGGQSVSQRYTLLATNISAIPSNAPPRLNYVSPGSTNVAEGLTLALSANCVYWTGPVTAQWRKDGTDIPGATNFFGFDTGHIKSGVTRDDAGAYTVVLRNAFGAITSAVMNITVSAAPPVPVGGADALFNPGAGPAFGSGANVVRGMIGGMDVLPDGRVIVGGFWDRWDNKPNPGLALLNSNGSLDESFVVGLSNAISPTNFSISAVAAQADGKILVTWLGGLARLNADGSRDLSFSNLTISAKQIVVQPDGKILLANFQGGLQALARLNADGSWDRAFARGNDYYTGSARHILLQPDGKIVVFGRPQYSVGPGVFQFVSASRIVRLNADGSLDSSFTAGVSPSESDEAAAGAVGLQADGHILIGGAMSLFNSTYGSLTNVHGLLRLNANGSLDTAFKVGDGVCTKFTFPGNVIPPIYMCGSVATFFGPADGKIFLGGIFTAYGGAGRTNLARMNSDGTVDSGFDPAAASPDGEVQFIKPTTGGKLYIAGTFTKLGQVPRAGIARIAGTTPPAPDTKAPVVTITTPKGPTFTTNGSQLTVSGKATDDVSVRRVQVKLGAGNYTDASGTTDWQASFELQPGTNVIVVKASDAAGNASTATLTVLYTVSSVVHLTVNGLGTVTPNIDGTTQVLGKALQLSAVPAKGWVFSNWIAGAQTILAPKTSFVVESNLSITANFVTNPFAASKAVFNGLVLNDAAPSHSRSGSISINLLDTGKFTGSLIFGGKKFAFAGIFDLSRQTIVSIPIKPGTGSLTLRLAMNEPGNALAGTLTDLEGDIAVHLNQAVLAKTAPAIALAGNYTLLFQPDDGQPIDIGDGYGTLKLDVSGNASLTGALPDGSPAVQKVALAADGSWPLYISLYAGQGSIVGWVSVNASAPNALLATNGLLWTRPAQPKPPYAGGFTNRFVVLGSPYVAPSTNRVLHLDAGVVILAHGNLPQSITNSIRLEPNNKVTNLGSNKLAVVITTPTGLMSGSVTPPGATKPIAFKGAVLQRQNFGGGFFTGTNQTGQVYLGE